MPNFRLHEQVCWALVTSSRVWIDNPASELTGCEILGKAEFLNPAGSVKNRAAYGIIADAEALLLGGLMEKGP